LRCQSGRGARSSRFTQLPDERLEEPKPPRLTERLPEEEEDDEEERKDEPDEDDAPEPKPMPRKALAAYMGPTKYPRPEWRLSAEGLQSSGLLPQSARQSSRLA
jgi:hypothetical protein